MKLVNNNGQVHLVYVDLSTCDVKITREGMSLVKLQFDLSIGFVDAMTKIKRIVNLEDELYQSLAGLEVV